jgi:hypothetical protein
MVSVSAKKVFKKISCLCTFKERNDQGQVHPKLEVPRLTCLGLESNPGLRGGRQGLWKRAIRTASVFVIQNFYIIFIFKKFDILSDNYSMTF